MRQTPQYRRVEAVGGRLITAAGLANADIGFLVPGTPNLELYHPTERRLVISEGLVDRCRNDDQLAAVLAMELAKMATERQARINAVDWQVERDLPPDVRIGPEDNLFGAADQIRKAEIVKLGLDRRRPADACSPLPTDPILLAQRYLVAAGFAPAELESAPGLLQSARRVSPMPEK